MLPDCRPHGLMRGGADHGVALGASDADEG